MRTNHTRFEIKLDSIEEGLQLDLIQEKNASIYTISEDESFQNGEAMVQILEGKSYEYIFNKPNYRLKSYINGIILPSAADLSRGRIVPNIYVGTLTLLIYDENHSENEVTYSLEVLATKLHNDIDRSYRKNYRKMLEDITLKSTDLLLQLNSPIQQNLSIDFGKDNKTVYQRFCFVRSIIDSKEFQEATQRIIALPKTSWIEKSELKDVHRIKRFASKEIKQLVSNGNRTNLDHNHPLKKLGLDSIPKEIYNSSKHDDVDNPENRFVKHALTTFLDFCTNCSTVFNTKSREYAETKSLIATLETYLQHPFFREISRPLTLPLNSPVLQRRAGYRELLKAWLMFDLAAKLIWEGGEDVYEGGKRDIATLYEYWLFFALYDLFKSKFKLHQHELEGKDIESLFEKTKNDINLILKSGKHTALRGSCDFGTRKLRIKFSYNRSFKGGKVLSETRSAGSWTTTLRPDYTLSFWPYGISEVKAEETEEIVHIHFDAKYKVEQFIVNTKANSEELEEESKNERKGIYKNADLLKMHAYKDAIRRTGGAYVLYPGTDKKNFSGFHEIIPGLGAFAVNPDNEKEGLDHLSEFIDTVLENLLDRSSQRERMSSKIYEIHKEVRTDKLNEQIPEHYNNEKVIPDETFVLIGYYKSKEHLAWILKNELYNFRTGTRNGSLNLTPENIGAKYLILHGKNDLPTRKIFELKNTGPRIYSKNDLDLLKYPDVKGDLYIVYEIANEVSKEFGDAQWDLNQLANFELGRNSQKPITSTLSQLMKCKV